MRFGAGGRRRFVGGSNVRIVRGATLAPGDEIDTTGGGRVVIDLTDGSQVVILPGSRVTVLDYRNASSLRELLQITLGRIRVKINHFQGKPNPYRIKSPTASIAVRGTEFLVTVAPLGETRVVVIEGAVEVANLKDPTKKLVAEPKHGVVVRPDSSVDFFTAAALTKEAGERDRQNNGTRRIKKMTMTTAIRAARRMFMSEPSRASSKRAKRLCRRVLPLSRTRTSTVSKIRLTPMRSRPPKSELISSRQSTARAMRTTNCATVST